MKTAPKIISLDIETYGAVEYDAAGNPMPEQTVFNIRRTKFHDAPPSPIISVAITLPKKDTREYGQWNLKALAALRPGPTIVLYMHIPEHRKMLRHWIAYADTIIGMNLLFDIQYLQDDPYFRPVLNERHTLIDVSVANYLHNENRAEKSLKDLGPILGSYLYESTLKDGRFKDPFTPNDKGQTLGHYNGEDTHNSIIAVYRLCERIIEDFAEDTAKFSPDSVKFFSDSFWSCIRMGVNGLPMNRNGLIQYETLLRLKIDIAYNVMLSKYGVRLHGCNSDKDKEDYIRDVIREVDILRHQSNPEDTRSVMDLEAFAYTDSGAISHNMTNRLLMMHFLPKDHAMHHALHLWNIHGRASKMVSSFTRPLLHKASTKNPYSSILNPLNPSSTTMEEWLAQTAYDTGTVLPKDKTNRRTRTPAQWKTRHAHKQLRKAPCSCTYHKNGRPKECKACKARRKASEPKVVFSCYQPIDPPQRKGVAASNKPLVSIAPTNWYVTPSYQKGVSGDEGGQIQTRLSVKGPAAQTFPRDIKRYYASRFPDGVILAVDVVQAELRAAALLSGEQTLIDFYSKPGGDLHGDRAAAVFGEWVRGHEDFRRIYRHAGKQANFSDVNRASWKGIQSILLKVSQIYVEDHICQSIEYTRASVRPQLWAWQEELIAKARRDGYIEMPYTGASRHFLGGDKYDISEIVNLPIQATAATTFRCIQHAVCDYYPIVSIKPSPLLFLNIYDAMYWDCPTRATAEELAQVILDEGQAVQTNGHWAKEQDRTGNTVPLEFDIDIDGVPYHVEPAGVSGS